VAEQESQAMSTEEGSGKSEKFPSMHAVHERPPKHENPLGSGWNVFETLMGELKSG